MNILILICQLTILLLHPSSVSPQTSAIIHHPSPRSVPTISAIKAREVARQQVIWQGRLCPLSTAARDFLTSVYGRPTYKGLTPEQVVYGWLLRPEVWKDEPMIRIPDAPLRRQLSIEGECASFSQLFDDTLGYRLPHLGADLPERMRPLVRETSPVVDLDERVAQIILLTRGQLFRPRPADMEPLPSWRVEAEILWNATPRWLLLLLVATALAAIAFSLLSHNSPPLQGRDRCGVSNVKT